MTDLSYVEYCIRELKVGAAPQVIDNLMTTIVRDVEDPDTRMSLVVGLELLISVLLDKDGKLCTDVIGELLVEKMGDKEEELT